MKKIILSLFILFLTQSNAFANADYGLLFGTDRLVIGTIGDSITAGSVYDIVGLQMAYRDHLQDLLRPKFGMKFIGHTASPASDPIYQTENFSAAGITTAQILTILTSNLSIATSENVYLLYHAGTNDVGTSVATATSIDNIEDSIDLAVSQNANVKMLVSLIIPRRTDNAAIETFNTALLSMLETKQSTNSNIIIVDMYSLFVDDTLGLCDGDYANICLVDAVHPTETGWVAMARQYALCMADSTNTGCNGN